MGTMGGEKNSSMALVEARKKERERLPPWQTVDRMKFPFVSGSGGATKRKQG